MKTKSRSRRAPTPEGLRNLARGCEARATPGKIADVHNPGGVVPPTDRICIICGCTDSRACYNGCSWIQLHNYGNTGVCSNCYHFALSNLTNAINESEEVVFATSNVFTPPELSAAIKSSLASAS